VVGTKPQHRLTKIHLNEETGWVLRSGREDWPLSLWGSRTRSPVLTWDFYAARSYSLMRPPSTGLRLIRFQERSVAG
jgi:hypothetical protein